MSSISEARILIMATDGFEQSELQVPLEKLRAAGARVDVAAPEGASEIKGWLDKNWGGKVPVDLEIAAAEVEDYDALVLPGGQMNPDVLRMNDDAIALIQEFIDAGKVVAAICHAPWLLVEADAVDGKTITSWPSIRTDVENAGGEWVDQEVVIDDGLITSRSPKDLDAFVAAIIEQVEAGLALDEDAKA
ncbi:MAG: type 1 glutamine amidotransferase domain-containing protein [Beijerinckiaceae bacterium]|nr:type 1 glutamine amidotransferase domain-containing protein [Beijerinckiaceae bacterium]